MKRLSHWFFGCSSHRELVHFDTSKAGPPPMGGYAVEVRLCVICGDVEEKLVRCFVS